MANFAEVTTSSFKFLFAVFHNLLATEIVNKSYFCLESFLYFIYGCIIYGRALLFTDAPCGVWFFSAEVRVPSVFRWLLWDWEGNVSRTIKHKTRARTEIAG